MSSSVTPYEVQKQDILLSSTTRYRIIDFNGEGSFGKVTKCVNLMTGDQVAVKIHKDRGNVSEVIQKEIEMLRAIRTLDADKHNIVNFMEDFTFNNLSCLAFEMLDRSLWNLMKERRCSPLSLNEIRPVIQQLMVAFGALKSIGIIHADLKPDNIMLVNHQDQPFKIKLIDFGLARQVSTVRIGTIMQPSSHRAPEVTLGLPITEAVDMWGVGCIMAFLYFGNELFPRKCPYNLIRSIVHLLGQPADHLLDDALSTWTYFSWNYDPDSPGWRLKSPDEFYEVTGIEPDLTITFFDFIENLEEAVLTYPAKKNNTEFDDRMAFLSLLESTLEMDPDKRITPGESLKSPFLSMVHLESKNTSSYTDKALRHMTFMPLKHLDSGPESDVCSSNTDIDSSEKMDSIEEKSEPQAIKADFNIKPVSLNLHYDEAWLEELLARYGEDVPKIKEHSAALQHEEKELKRELEQKIHKEEIDKETGVIMVKQQAQNLQQEIQNLRAEQEALHQKMVEEITILQQNALEKEKIFEMELDKLRTQLSVQISLSLKLSTELKAERESIPNVEPIEGTKEAEVPEEMPCEQQETISPALALRSQKEAEENLPQRIAKLPSVWKRVRHFLGLRKPKSWKKKKQDK